MDVAASAEMHKRVAAQICLIDKVGVLLRLAVEGHKTLLVLTGLAALTATVRAEVEPIPDVHCPDVRALRPHFEHMLVVDGLVAFRPVAALRAGALVGGVCVRAELRQTDDAVGVVFVERVKKFIVLLQFTQVPAVVEIITANIGQLHKRVVGIQHKSVRHCGGAGGVQAMAEVVQKTMVRRQVFCHAGGDGNLIG